MSNLPKIHGFCKAGCQWETVHRSEFEASASIIKLYPDGDGKVFLELGKKYKIYAPIVDNQFVFRIEIEYYNLIGESKAIKFAQMPRTELYNSDKYADSFEFRICEFSITGNRETNDLSKEFLLVVEFNGTKQTFTSETAGITDLMALPPKIQCFITEASEVFLFNADATIKGEKGDAGSKIVSTELIGQDDNGGNIYQQTFEDGSTAQFVAPKGEQGMQGIQGEKGEKGERGDGAIPKTEQVTIPASAWETLANSQPFFYQTTITLNSELGEDTVISLVNDNPVFFANFGLVLASVSGQDLTIYATNVPVGDTTITLSLEG